MYYVNENVYLYVCLSIYQLQCWSFFQEIIPEESNVKMLGTKVEINLKKAEPFSWADLEYKPPVEKS